MMASTAFLGATTSLADDAPPTARELCHAAHHGPDGVDACCQVAGVQDGPAGGVKSQVCFADRPS